MQRLTWLSTAALATAATMTVAFPTSAAAPARSGQPYAEAAKCNDPNVLMCEDFDNPANFTYTGKIANDSTDWFNPGLTTGHFGFVYGLDGRRINPATDYPTQPQGSSAQNHVWVANWDASKGAQGNGSTWGKLREPGGNYANGSAPAKDLYFRFQYYVTANYTWPGDPKLDAYNYGSGSQPFDNKIFYVYPPEGMENPTGATYDAGLHTQAGTYYAPQNARFSDMLAVRYGNTDDNYKYFPFCSVCSFNPSHDEYGPFQSLTLRNPHDTPTANRALRFDTNRWYTIEMRYKLSSVANAKDGAIEVWVDGVKIYSELALATCGSGQYGDCSGIGAIYLGAYHNALDTTAWNGQQVIDNLVVSRAYIGPPGYVGPSTPPADTDAGAPSSGGGASAGTGSDAGSASTPAAAPDPAPGLSLGCSAAAGEGGQGLGGMLAALAGVLVLRATRKRASSDRN
mgnify:CR=1 FL=1